MKTRQRRRSAWMFVSALVASLLAACSLDESGSNLPRETIHYPIAVALSGAADGGRPSALFVANSNFDLSYSSGSIQAYDLDELQRWLESDDPQRNKTNCRTQVVLTGVRDASVVPDYTRPLAPGAPADAAAPDDDADADAGLAGDPGLDGGAPALDGDLLDPGAADGGSDAGAPVDAASLDAEALDADVADAASDIDAAQPGTIVVPSGAGVLPEGRRDPGALCDGRADDPCCLTTDALDRPQFEQLLLDSRPIDSFATGLAVSPDGQRVYVPISSRSRVVYLDWQSGSFGCGSQSGRCTRGPGRGRSDDDPEEKFPGQPSAIAVGTLGDLVPDAPFPQRPIVATAHESGGVALFVESAYDEAAGRVPETSQLVLESVRPSVLATSASIVPTSVVIDPRNHVLYATVGGDSTLVSRFGARISDAPASGESGPRELVYSTTRITLSGVARAADLRDLAIDPRNPRRLYVLVGGTQQSVLFVELDPSSPFEANVTDVVRIGNGPSKLAYTELAGRSFLLASAYDSRSIFIIDTETKRLVSVVRGLSGPYSMAVDSARQLVYVADFRTSVLRVIDLAGLVDRSKPPPSIVATLGALRFTGSLQ